MIHHINSWIFQYFDMKIKSVLGHDMLDGSHQEKVTISGNHEHQQERKVAQMLNYLFSFNYQEHLC